MNHITHRLMNTLGNITVNSGKLRIASLSIITIIACTYAQALTLIYDFSRTSGDRAHNFGTNQTSGLMSDENNSNGWRVVTNQGFRFTGSNASGPISAWSLVNDNEPDTVNNSLPGGSGSFEVGSTLLMRTRILSQTSGVGGINSYGGFLFGIDDFTSSSNGFLATIERNPGGSDNGKVSLYNFSAGEIGSLINTSSFTYGGGDILFLSFSIFGGNYELGAYADADISGSGNDISRLTSSDFSTATPVASIAGTLAGYSSGFTGVYTAHGSTTTNGGTALGNFYLTTVPEPGTYAVLLSLAVLGLTVLSKKHRRR